jgi:uncharacterized protein with PQ loop repeat
VPQFLPQLARLRRTGDTAGVSWAWAALTSVNNGAWTGYFALSHLWTALVSSISATLLTAPSVSRAYRSDRASGISAGTWLLILGELLCWGLYGTYESDPRLMALGWTGVAASLLVLARATSKKPIKSLILPNAPSHLHHRASWLRSTTQNRLPSVSSRTMKSGSSG